MIGIADNCARKHSLIVSVKSTIFLHFYLRIPRLNAGAMGGMGRFNLDVFNTYTSFNVSILEQEFSKRRSLRQPDPLFVFQCSILIYD